MSLLCEKGACAMFQPKFVEHHLRKDLTTPVAARHWRGFMVIGKSEESEMLAEKR